MYSQREYNTRDDGSEIYVVDNRYNSEFPSNPRPPPQQHYQQSPRPPSNMSYKPESIISNKNKAGIVMETMSAPNPLCPRAKGVCCLLVLVNLGLILITLGFSIVLQLFEPAFVWYCGILFLLVGTIALISSLIFCVSICRENQRHQNPHDNNLYWTSHWQKRIDI
ncbi:uncharacterized protein LOC110863553 [Folsomia candida]|uniref:uncharacterized protein LOC110863553 n=1 Tax=Folsomia candida TaxID=158441 RepID=UPI000B908C65|nr:uncharacterized protein LOC110863553 [Folsomia candida]